jgi:hypothetical protein
MFQVNIRISPSVVHGQVGPLVQNIGVMQKRSTGSLYKITSRTFKRNFRHAARVLASVDRTDVHFQFLHAHYHLQARVLAENFREPQ